MTYLVTCILLSESLLLCQVYCRVGKWPLLLFKSLAGGQAAPRPKDKAVAYDSLHEAVPPSYCSSLWLVGRRPPDQRTKQWHTTVFTKLCPIQGKN